MSDCKERKGRKIIIYPGSDVLITVPLKDKVTGQPFPLPGFSGATAYFDSDPASVYLGASIPASGGLGGSFDTGVVQFVLTKVQTNALLVGEDQSVQINVDIDNGVSRAITQLIERMDVPPSLIK